MDTDASILALHLQQLRNQLGREGTLMLGIKVIPRARTASVSDLMANGVLKVKVTAAPEKGRANDEVCTVIAEALGVAKRNVEIVSGHTGAQKRVRVTRLVSV
ncbi:MAG: DUF167 domain-containing protein [Acidobacteriaceae bacterium]